MHINYFSIYLLKHSMIAKSYNLQNLKIFYNFNNYIMNGFNV
jgi:hypothetical protein